MIDRERIEELKAGIPPLLWSRLEESAAHESRVKPADFNPHPHPVVLNVAGRMPPKARRPHRPVLVLPWATVRDCDTPGAEHQWRMGDRRRLPMRIKCAKCGAQTQGYFAGDPVPVQPKGEI